MIFGLCQKCSSPKVKTVINAALVNLFNVIWFARNQKRFHNKLLSWRTSIASLISCTSLTSNLTSAVSYANKFDFALIKKFNITIHPPRDPQILEVMWHPPLQFWTKCNTNGSSDTHTSSYGGIFKNHNSDFLLSFA